MCPATCVTIAAGICVGTALLVAWWRGSDLLRSATLGLYLGGALLIVVPLLGAGGRSYGSGDYVFYEIDTDPASHREAGEPCEAGRAPSLPTGTGRGALAD